ncbi:MAG: glycosyltransferase family 39 protein [Planctomycetota bacterium]|nr:glycosyltransferase family 39 protein [Planctomycetota bacterium]
MLVPSNARCGERLLWLLLAVLACAAMLALTAHIALRLGYRYDLEWMEGAMVDHAERARTFTGIYTAPRAEHVPFLYTPMLFWLGALVSSVTLTGPLALRLVSVLAFVGCAVLIYCFVRREVPGANRKLAALCAAGLFCAGYGFLRSWYDLARNDTLFLLGMLATGWLLRFGGRREAMLAGVTAAFAFLSKQSALLWLPALGVGLLAVDWRRALVFAASCGLVIGGTALALHIATDGWFTFYVFEMPQYHGWQGEYKLKFFTSDLVPIAPLMALSITACAQRWRLHRGQALQLAALFGGALLTSYLSRLHVGGFDNVMMPVLAIGCMLAPIAAANARSASIRIALLLVLCAQFALLTLDVRAALEPDRAVLMGFGPQFLPTTENQRANEELVAAVAQLDGPVFMPFHGNLAALAGKPRMAHAQAIHDLLSALPRSANGTLDILAIADPARLATLSPHARTALTSFYGSVHEALSQKKFAAVVLDQPLGPVFESLFAAALTGNYERQGGELLSKPTASQPAVGMVTHSPYFLLRKK